MANPCPGCFAEKGHVPVCPFCGYDENAARGRSVLPYWTVLNRKYLVGRMLGKRGGFGITYLAFDRVLSIPVAIKEFLPGDIVERGQRGVTVVPNSPEDEELFRYGLHQFLEEARIVAGFDHAHLVRVRDYFEENGTGYIVMNYYRGMTLGEYLEKLPGGRMPETAALAVMQPILDGLREVHSKWILHRDVKPANIYLAENRRPVLLDFGAARVALGERSKSLSMVLTPGYAPYEQYHSSGKQGPWLDVYSCAAVLYRMVGGRVPPEAPARVERDDLQPLSQVVSGVSRAFSDAVRAGLEVRCERRPQTVEAFQQALAAAVPDQRPSRFAAPANPRPVPAAPRSVAPAASPSARAGGGYQIRGPAAVERPTADTFQLRTGPAAFRPEEVDTRRSTTRRTAPADNGRGGGRFGLVLALAALTLMAAGAGVGGYLYWRQTPAPVRPVADAPEPAPVAETNPGPAEPARPPVIARDTRPAPAESPRPPASERAAESAAPAESAQAPPPAPKPELPASYRNSLGMEFALVPAGAFEMGCAPGKDACRPDEQPKHRVEISRSFYLGKYEVTQAQWERIMLDNPSAFKGSDRPVESVSWNDVQGFIARLNRKEGHSRYRLPTEAEWEYAARAGSDAVYSFGNDQKRLSEFAFINQKDSVGTQKVGRLKPNAWGLHDMHGNVWEWVRDIYGKDYYAKSPAVDPRGPREGEKHVYRGGDWWHGATRCRSALRNSDPPDTKSPIVGFRLALEVEQ